MTSSTLSSDPRVTLPPHLANALTAVLDLLPPETTALLTPYLRPSPAQTIPQPVLLQVSRHARAPATAPFLVEHGLNPRDYEMLSLLAGVRSVTSAVGDLKDPAIEKQQQAKQWKEDRRAITGVINGLVSVGGVAFAAWYAAGNAGWQVEWQALVALFAAAVVALAEGVLFLIWQERADRQKQRAADRVQKLARLAREKAPSVETKQNFATDPSKAIAEAVSDLSSEPLLSEQDPKTEQKDPTIEQMHDGSEQESDAVDEERVLDGEETVPIPDAPSSDITTTLRRRLPPTFDIPPMES